MQSDRPVNLNIFTINFPFAALVSITHRITGGILFVGFGFGLYALQMALSSPQGFEEAVILMTQPFSRFVMLGLIFVLSFHIVAGVKHLLLDFHIGDTNVAAKFGAQIVVVLTLISTALLGALLW